MVNSPAACPCNRHARSDHQGTEQLHGTPPFNLLRDVDRGTLAPRLWVRTADMLPGLDGEVFSSLHTTASPCAAIAWACS